MKYSIIIPIYNAQRYLSQCVASVLTQSVQDYEVILVNDGSVDESEKICGNYVRRDARFRLISQENRGSLAARATGIAAARGEYLLFLDADDQWLPNTLFDVDALLTQYQPDVLVFFFQRFGGAVAEVAPPISGTHFYEKFQFRDYVSVWLQDTALNAMCMRVVRRACLLPDAWSRNICFGDDLMQSAWVLHCARSLVYTDRVLYRYRVTPGSVLNRFQGRHVRDIAAAYEAVYQFLRTDFVGDTALTWTFFHAYRREICNAALRLFCVADRGETKRWTAFLRTNALFCGMMEQPLPKTTRQRMILRLIQWNRPELSRWGGKLIDAIQTQRRHWAERQNR